MQFSLFKIQFKKNIFPNNIIVTLRIGGFKVIRVKNVICVLNPIRKSVH